MKNILSRQNREVLAQFAWSHTLIAFDFDGTLAPIVSTPDRASMRAVTRSLLRKLASLYPCAVISGRSRRDVRERLYRTELVAVVGNHGVEPRWAQGRFRAIVARWHAVLENDLKRLTGVDIENKGYSLAIHYRRSREKKKALGVITSAVGRLRNARVIGGLQVVNVLPEGAPHKGMALEREWRRLRCDTAVYVGDDDTDEDVFAMRRPGRLLTIRVGDRRGSSAAYCVRDQRQVDQLIRALIELRQGRNPGPR